MNALDSFHDTKCRKLETSWDSNSRCYTWPSSTVHVSE